MKTTFRNSVKTCLVVAALACTTHQANAVTLADLLQPNATLVSGDKVFFGFHNATQHGDFAIPFTEIFVDPVVGVGGFTDGIRHSLFLSAVDSDGPNQQYDLGLDFHVGTLAGAARITDNTLRLGGDFTGDGRATVAESVIDHLTGGSLATKLVFMDKFGQSFLDHQVFPGGPYAEIEISKDFAMVTGPAAGSSVSVRHFDQTFSQVPESGPGLLATFSLLGALCWAGRMRFLRNAH